MLDSVSATHEKNQQKAENKPKTLSDALFFNKFEERNHSKYAVASLKEVETKETKKENAGFDDEYYGEEYDDEDYDDEEDEDVRAWKRKKRLEAKQEQAERERLA